MPIRIIVKCMLRDNKALPWLSFLDIIVLHLTVFVRISAISDERDFL